MRTYKPFFLRSAQRFFIASDNRLLPSGVIPPRRFLFGKWPAARRLFFEVRGEIVPSRALIARVILSPSCLRSARIFLKSKLFSFL